VVGLCIGAGISENDFAESMNLYPNPSTGLLSLDFSFQHPGKKSLISVYNVLGEKVYESYGNYPISAIDISDQSNGVYFLKVNSENTSTIKRIIISK
jgi:hypothetical protein